MSASPAVSASAQGRIAAVLRSASVWHYASLVVGLVVIMIMQQNQWFFFDEWNFLQLDSPGLWASHVGHWSTAPTLVYDGLRAVFGLRTYFPYALAVTILHLAAAHLAWRMAIRAGANGWIASAAVFVFIFFGAGSENILWAFQIGFVGAAVVGLLSFLMALSTSRSIGRFVAITAISLFSLSWSGTALPIVAATTAALLIRQGWRRATVFLAGNAVVYLAWYVLNAAGTGPDTGGFGLYKLFVAIPEFIGVMLVVGFGSVLPVPYLGAALLVALVVWLVITLVRRNRIPELVPALLLAGAAAVFILLTAYSRAALSVGSGRSSRYLYLVLLLILPLIAVSLTRIVARRTALVPVVAAGLLLIGGYQAVVLGQDAFGQAQTEQGTKRLLSAALELYLTDAPGLNLSAVPDPTWAPDITMQELVDLYESGMLPQTDYTPADLAQARTNVIAP